MTPPDFVPFRLTVCGIDELPGHCDRGVSHVLSILDPGLPAPPAFGSFGEHERLDLRFDDIIDPMEGKHLPEEAHVRAVLDFGRGLLQGPDPITAEAPHLLVHCHMGVSRSTASMTLILAQARPDLPPADALAEVVRIRPQAWPNLLILEMGDALLGLGGALVDAGHARYRAMVEEDPRRAELFRSFGRGRELERIPGP